MPACGLPSWLYAQPASTATSLNVPSVLFRYSALGFESLATYRSTQPSSLKSSVLTPRPYVPLRGGDAGAIGDILERALARVAVQHVLPALEAPAVRTRRGCPCSGRGPTRARAPRRDRSRCSWPRTGPGGRRDRSRERRSPRPSGASPSRAPRRPSRLRTCRRRDCGTGGSVPSRSRTDRRSRRCRSRRRTRPAPSRSVSGPALAVTSSNVPSRLLR